MKEKACSVGARRKFVPAYRKVCESCYRRKISEFKGDSGLVNGSVKKEEVIE